MKESIFGLDGFILFFVAAVTFVLLFVVIHKVLKEVSFFKGATATIVALCVSILSTIGLSQFIVGGSGVREVNNNEGRIGGIWGFILLLYAALGIAIISLLSLKFITKLFRSETAKRYPEETKRGRMERRYPCERASKTSEKSDEKTHIRK